MIYEYFTEFYDSKLSLIADKKYIEINSRNFSSYE